MYIVHEQMINSYFSNHRSQCCFSWGNLPDDLLHYILQIHASNIIKTAFRNSLLRRVNILSTQESQERTYALPHCNLVGSAISMEHLPENELICNYNSNL